MILHEHMGMGLGAETHGVMHRKDWKITGQLRCWIPPAGDCFCIDRNQRCLELLPISSKKSSQP